MRNILLFIGRYFNFFFFLILQGFCIYLIVHYSRYHNAVFSGVSTQLTGKINAQYNKIEDYFHLKKTNDSLIKANERLYNKLKADYEIPDFINKAAIDSLHLDSLERYRRYNYQQATVVANAVNTQSNFVVVGKGSAQKVQKGMGVIDINNGAVGIITETTADYAVVMSLLHTESRISGKLLKGGEVGTLIWDGKTPNIVSIVGIPKSAKVVKGDTIITSGFSTSFPKGVLLGFVDEVIPERSTNNFLIKFKTAANFYNLQYVYIIDNFQKEAIDSLLDKIKTKNQ